MAGGGGSGHGGDGVRCGEEAGDSKAGIIKTNFGLGAFFVEF